MNDLSTYSDETLTGESGDAFRGLDRATIAARVSSESGFEWLREIATQYLPKGAEPKAKLVLQLAKSKPTVRALVERGVGSSVIAIVDLGEVYKGILTSLAAAVGDKPPTRRDVLRLIAEPSARGALVTKLLAPARAYSLHRTIIPRVERLLRRVAKTAGLETAGELDLFDREALARLDQRGFQELVARFSLALGDALAPDAWRSAVLSALDEARFISEGYVAHVTLGEAVGVNRYFDVGHATAFASVQAAHTSIVDVLTEANDRFFGRPLRTGTIRQEDSASVLGVQAADIAARFASQIYEQHPDDRRAGALAVKQRVDRVLLNDDWL